VIENALGWARGVAQVVERLPSNLKALSSTTCTERQRECTWKKLCNLHFFHLNFLCGSENHKRRFINLDETKFLPVYVQGIGTLIRTVWPNRMMMEMFHTCTDLHNTVTISVVTVFHIHLKFD
jgi:hypothetical protein